MAVQGLILAIETVTGPYVLLCRVVEVLQC